MGYTVSVANVDAFKEAINADNELPRARTE